MGDGSWLFPLVRRNGHDRQFARVRGIACCTAYSGHGGVRRLPLLRKDFGAPRSGSGPRIRKRAHRRGVGCGPALGTFFGGTLMARYGWRPFFIVLGLASMAWLIPWFAWMPGGKATTVSPVTERGAGFLQLLKQRSMWGTCGGLFGANYVLYFEITWLPYYLERERHFPVATMVKIVGVGYLCYSAGATIFGWVSDRWIAAGGTPTLVRKTIAGVGAGSAGLLLLGCALAGPAAAVLLLLLAFAAGGMCGSNIWAITQTLAGPRMAGRWTGVQKFLGNISGVT